MGYPEEFGKTIAKNLGAERAMRRMISYLCQAKPQSLEEIADEMFSIRSDIDRWKQKKLNEEANAHYNQLRWEGLWDTDEDDE